MSEQTVEENYNKYWKEIVENPDGTINLEQIKKELSDYTFLLEEVPKVYCYVTGGELSYPNYCAKTVITKYEDDINENYVYKDDVKDILNDENVTDDDKIKLIKELIKY